MLNIYKDISAISKKIRRVIFYMDTMTITLKLVYESLNNKGMYDKLDKILNKYRED